MVFPTRPGQSGDKQALIREAFRLEWLTIGWMTVEAIVAIASGLVAGSLVLTAFGLDSLIELASAGVLIWRLTIELRRGERFSEKAERIASTAGRPSCFVEAATDAALKSPCDAGVMGVKTSRAR